MRRREEERKRINFPALRVERQEERRRWLKAQKREWLRRMYLEGI